MEAILIFLKELVLPWPISSDYIPKNLTVRIQLIDYLMISFIKQILIIFVYRFQWQTRSATIPQEILSTHCEHPSGLRFNCDKKVG